jgi:N-methylhydantoinase B
VPSHAEVIVRTGGGGGWGDPLTRDPDLVRVDVIEGVITRRAARDYYGVELWNDFSVDRDATERLRAAMRGTGSTTQVLP